MVFGRPQQLSTRLTHTRHAAHPHQARGSPTPSTRLTHTKHAAHPHQARGSPTPSTRLTEAPAQTRGSPDLHARDDFFDHALGIFGGAERELGAEDELLGVGEIAAAAAGGVGVVHRDGGGDGDVEALDEAVHWDDDGLVGFFDHFGRDAVGFVAEDDGGGNGEIHLADRARAGVEVGREDLVAAAFEFAGTIAGGLPAFDVEPFVGALADAVGVFEAFVEFDDVGALKAHGFGGAQDRADVAAVVDVLEHGNDVARAVLDGGANAFLAVVSEMRRK